MDELQFRTMVEGAVLGFAVGDALGVPAEFMSRAALARNPVTGMRGGGAHAQPAGTWSDDTSMTLCMLDSLADAGIDYEDQMRRFESWLNRAEYTARGEVFDVGGTTRSAVSRHARGRAAVECGDTAEACCGNGSLMRILPLALYFAGHDGLDALDAGCMELIHAASGCTHAHPRCKMACGIYCSVALRLCAGDAPADAVRQGVEAALKLYRPLKAFSDVYDDFVTLESIAAWPPEQLRGSGYVLHTLQAALHCLSNAPTYAECVLRAVALGEDTDTTAAVAGGLIGLCGGAQAIPEAWLDALAKREELRSLCRRFADACLQR